MSATYTLSIIVDGQDRASGPLGGIAGVLTNIGTIAGGILTADIFRNLGNGIMDFGSRAIDATAQMQAFEMGLQTLVTRELRTKDETLSMNDAFAQAGPLAANIAEKLKDIAITSPYQLGTVQDTFRLAMAFGFASDEAEKFTKGMLNMAAGVGASDEMLGRMAYNFAQIRLQGKVTAMDVRQLAMAGFDLNAALKDIGAQFGVTINDFQDFNNAVAAGKIKWEDFAGAFEQYANKNFGDAAKRMSTTLQGLKSTFADLFILTMPTLLGPAAESVTKFANKILEKIVQFSKDGTLTAWADGIKESVDEVIGKLEFLFNFFSTYDLADLLDPNKFKTVMANAFGVYINVDAIKKQLQTTFGGIFAGLGAGATGVFAGISAAGLAGPLVTAFKGVGANIASSGAFQGLGAIFATGMADDLAMSGASPLIVGLNRMFSAASPAIAGFGAKFMPLAGGAGKILTSLLPLAPVVGNLGLAFGVGALALTAFGVGMKAMSGDTKFFGDALAVVQNGVSKFGQFWTDQGPAIAEIGAKVWKGLSEAGNELAKTVVPWMLQQFGKFSQWFVENGPLITEFIGVLATFFTDKLLPAIVGFWDIVQPILTAILDGIGGLATAVMQMATGDWAGAWESLGGVANGLWEGIKGAWTGFVAWVTGWFGTDWATVSQAWADAWNMLPGVLTWVWESIKQSVLTWWTDFTTVWGENAALFGQIVVTGWETIKTAAQTKWDEIKLAISTKLTEIATTLTAKADEMKGKWQTGLDNLKTAAMTVWTDIKTNITNKITEIVTNITNSSNQLFKAGQNLFQGLLDGISSKVDEVISYLEDALADIVDLASQIFDINSPSRVFFVFGKQIMAGLANGIAAYAGDAAFATQTAGRDVIDALPTEAYGPPGASAMRATGQINIYIDGARDPEAVANAIYRKLEAQGVVA